MSALTLTLIALLLFSTGVSVYSILTQRKLRRNLGLLRSEYARVSRRSADYFGVIESVLSERDQWKEMWFEGAAGHQEAQFMLETDLQATRYMLSKAIFRLNKQREKIGLEPMKAPKELDAPPYGKSADYVALCKRLEEKMAPRTVDWLKKRYHISLDDDRLLAEDNDEEAGADQQARPGDPPQAVEAHEPSVDEASGEARP